MCRSEYYYRILSGGNLNSYYELEFYNVKYMNECNCFFN